MVGTIAIAGLAVAAVLAVVGSAAAIIYLGADVRSWPRRVASRLLGGPGNYASRALVGLLVLLASVAGAGIWYAITADFEATTSSAPVITTILKWGTTGWGYLLVALVLGRGTVWGIRSALIRRSAYETGYSTRTIKRLAEEIRTTDGSTRVIAFDDDDLRDLADRILEALQEGTDEVIRRAEPDSSTDVPALPEAADEESSTTSSSTGDADDRDLSLGERFKLWRLDLASGLSIDAVVWRFAVPTAVTFAALLVVAQLWVRWWLYLVLGAAAVAVGLTVYLGSSWVRSRRLDALRAERDAEYWNEIAVLAKTVDTGEMTVYMAFFNGRKYASTDPNQLAETVAGRALEKANGREPSPAIEERWAWCLDHYIPTLEAYLQQQELPAIQDKLVDEVLDAKEGILPKRLLSARVVEDGRRYIWRGTRHVGLGHDPRLVAEEYEQLVPNTLVERDLEITDPDGSTREVTAVRARTESLPADVGELRASFSERFPRRRIPERYDLPAVDVEEDADPFVTSHSPTDD